MIPASAGPVSPSARREPSLALVTLAAAVLAIVPFAGALGGGFVYDDHFLVEHRAALASLRNLPSFFGGDFWGVVDLPRLHYYRPLVTASWALDHALWGGEPFGYHLTNLVLHAGVTALVFRALLRLVGKRGPAFAATLLWAWHPTKVEAVAWIAGRPDLLVALGLLLMMTGAGWRLRGERVGFGLALEIAGLALALLSKESAVVAPALVAVEAWSAAGRPALTRATIARPVRAALPHAAVAIAYLLARARLLPLASMRTRTFSVRDRALDAIETVGELARAVAWPHPLSVQRAPLRLGEGGALLHDPTRLAIGVLTAGLVIAAIVGSRRKRPAQAIGLLLATATFAPASNLVPTGQLWLFAERFAYVPLIGVALAIAAVLPFENMRTRPIVYALSGTVALAWAGLAVGHVRDFLDEASLWRHERAVDPDNPTALRFAATEALERKRPREALRDAVAACRTGPSFLGHREGAESALLAARALETVTPDADRATLVALDRFLRPFVDGRDAARIESLGLVVDAQSPDFAYLRAVAPGDLDEARTLAARLAERTGDCERAAALARNTLARPHPASSGAEAARTLARCGRWDEALAAAAREEGRATGARFVAPLAHAREALAATPRALEQALPASRALAFLGDRASALATLAPYRDRLLAGDESAAFYAHAALAAGDGEEARRALAARGMPAPRIDELLDRWSRELGFADTR